jgi:hypothetical protein
MNNQRIRRGHKGNEIAQYTAGLSNTIAASLFFLFILMLGSSCRQSTVTRSFYYWKTTFNLSPGEEKTLSSLNIRKLYIRFFDVNLAESSAEAIPEGKIHFVTHVPPELEVVPVVYIVNRTLLKIPAADCDTLALKILHQVQSIASSNHLSFHELQIDCDWTGQTRTKYFSMLSILRAELKKSNIILSATIRLHQVKYANLTGIPPVNRGMLMYYNMGRIDVSSGRNSIYNHEDALKYVAHVKEYPLPLDVALPMFSWAIQTRQGKIIALLDDLTALNFENNTNFIKSGYGQYVVGSSFFLRGFYFMKNDVVKIEQVTPELCADAAKEVSSGMKNNPGSVAIFHLDSLLFLTYEKKKFEKVYRSFR